MRIMIRKERIKRRMRKEIAKNFLKQSASLLIRNEFVLLSCYRGDAQIYSGAAEHVARAALHKSAVRGIQELRKVSRRWRIFNVAQAQTHRSMIFPRSFTK